MFNRSAQYAAYNVASHNVPKTKQIVMLYDGIIRFLQQAVEAIRAEKIEERYNLINRAGDVITGLRNCLDFESGGEVAKILDGYYAGIEVRLHRVQRKNSIEECEQVIKEIKAMRDAWEQVDSSQTGSSVVLTTPAPAPGLPKGLVVQV